MIRPQNDDRLAGRDWGPAEGSKDGMDPAQGWFSCRLLNDEVCQEVRFTMEGRMAARQFSLSVAGRQG